MTVPTSKFVKVRKKPVVVEALHVTSELAYAMQNGAVPTPEGVEVWSCSDFNVPELVFRTIDGNLAIVEIGDYIMRGWKGELYPCQRDIFEATYEIVKEKDLGILG